MSYSIEILQTAVKKSFEREVSCFEVFRFEVSRFEVSRFEVSRFEVSCCEVSCFEVSCCEVSCSHRLLSVFRAVLQVVTMEDETGSNLLSSIPATSSKTKHKGIVW
jgi:hypothetical protein